MSFGRYLDRVKLLLDRKPRVSILILAFAILLAGGIAKLIEAENFKREVQGQYNRAFHDLVDNVREIEVSLSKGTLANTPQQMVKLSSDVYRQAAFAKANIGLIPINDVQMDNTSKFLTQVGEYTYSLSRKVMDNQSVTKEELEQMNSLTKYAQNLSDGLSKMQNDLYSGKITINRLQYTAKNMNNTQNVSDGIKKVEEQFSDYPTLIYDGPFSAHIEKMNARYLQGMTDQKPDPLKDKVKTFIGADKAKQIDYSGEIAGNVAQYNYTAYPNPNDKARSISISYTKTGGIPIWMLDNRSVTSHTINVEAAKKAGLTFLNDRGFTGMRDTYFEIKNNIATINYAYIQNGIIMYPDLIKVQIAMDNGEVVGFESKGYLMSHQDTRSLPEIKITLEEARSKINPVLKVDKTSMAVIPTESKQELLCYEFKGMNNNKHFIIYVNAQTGKQEQILMLFETPDGILTM